MKFPSKLKQLDPVIALSAILFALYSWFFWKSVSAYWFNPEWTTDDAMQQLFPFHKILHPEVFKGDLITKMMECYLAPLHYWISYFFAWITGDPLMMGHWVMLVQVLCSVVLMFLLVRKLAGAAPAFFAAMWLLHTRHIMQRMTAGVPRGWAPTVLCSFLYFLVSGNHVAVLITLAVGCILHTPSTLIAALAYGLFLLWRVISPSTRASYKKHFIRYLIFSPFCALLAYSVVSMPEEIGTMASYQHASEMVEFQRPSGRFPFVPLNDAQQEIRSFAFQAFVGRFYSPGKFLRTYMAELVLSITVLLVIVGVWRKRQVIPVELWCYFIATFTIYFASRALAFKLYVPDRHLQIPVNIFWISALTVAAWRAFGCADVQGSLQKMWGKYRLGSVLALGALGYFIFLGSNTGLKGAMNFNTSRYKRGHAWDWIQQNTPETALIAGHPTWIDPVMLYGIRRGYVTTETAHPFYDHYYAEMKRRTDIALRINYARDLNELVSLARSEKIDYVVFENAAFVPQNLAKATYFPPFRQTVQQLAARPANEYAYAQLPSRVNVGKFPGLVFQDRFSKVVDIAALEKWLQSNGNGSLRDPS